MSTLNQAFSTGGGLATETTLLDVLAEAQDINTEVTSIDAKTPALGQALMAASVPVVIASNQSTVPVSVASLPLPSGAATEATQLLNEGWLNQLNSVFGLQNDAVATTDTGTFSFMAFVKRVLEKLSLIVTNTSDTASEVQTVDSTLQGIQTTMSSVDTNTAATGANTQSIDGKLGSLGQKAMAGSAPVVIASDQAAIPTTPSNPAASTVKQAAVTVGTSAVRITHDGSAPSAARRLLQFRPDPDSSAKFYYGSSSVTSTSTTRGIQVFPGELVEREFDAGDYYIISDTAGQTVFVVEQE